MNIDSIKNGIVLDHIKAGKSMEIYEILNLGKLDCSVAIIKNVNSTIADIFEVTGFSEILTLE